MQNKKSFYFLILVWTLSGCTKYLNQKPESSLAIPTKLEDLQAILNNETLMNDSYPTGGDVASDYYWVSDANWSTLNEDARANYIWDPNIPPAAVNWSTPYGKIYSCNLVLENVDHLSLNGLNETNRGKTKGEALFLRSWCFYQLAQLFSMPYTAESADQDLGIPLRTTTNVNIDVPRSTVAETYAKIEQDLKLAANLLPAQPGIAVRPGKGAAFAILARLYLAMGDFENGALYADSCLGLHSNLTDYSLLDTVKTGQVPILNEEVIFHARGFIANTALGTMGVVSESLYNLYKHGDLRKPLFYKTNSANVLEFSGDYSGKTSGAAFAGITTGEMLLTRAECSARTGKLPQALADMHELLKHRYTDATYQKFDTDDASEALAFILVERQKELAFRLGVRWDDIRRLNREPAFRITFTRIVQGKTYTLNPGDKKYAFLVPFDVVEFGVVSQTLR